MSDSDELKAMTERAKIAEARVAELLEKQSQIGGDKPLSGSLSSPADDSKLRQRAEAAEAQREELRAQKEKLEREMEEEEEKLRKALLDLDKTKGDRERIARLEEKLKQAPPPPPPAAPPPDTSELELQIKTKDEEVAQLSTILEEQQNALQKARQELEQARQAAAAPPLPPPPRPDSSALEDQLKGKDEEIARLNQELLEAANKVKASVDEVQRLTGENADLQQRVSELRRDNLELLKKANEARDEISIVSQSRVDGTQPKMPAQAPSIPEPTPQPVEEPQDVIVGTPVSQPAAPAPDDVEEDSLPEVEPLPGPAVSPPPKEPVVPLPKKSGFLWKFFLFLILSGAAFFAAWHFYPELFDFFKGEPQKADVVTPEDTQPEPIPPPPPEAPEEPAAESEEPAEIVAPEDAEEPALETEAKKSRAKKRRPKKTAGVIEDKMSVSEAKRQIRRLLSSKRLDEAQEMLAEWVKKKPRDAGLHYLYGRLHLMQGKKDQAVNRLERAIELAPRMSSAYHDLGAVYLQLGDNQSACEALGEFVRLKPNHPRAPAIKALMKKIECNR